MYFSEQELGHLRDALDFMILDDEKVLIALKEKDKTPETPEQFLAVVATQEERLNELKALRTRLGD